MSRVYHSSRTLSRSGVPEATSVLTAQAARFAAVPVARKARSTRSLSSPLPLSGKCPRTLLALPGNDFWLFDDETVLFNHFTGDGEVPARDDEEVTADPAVMKLCACAFETVWERATPHEGYRPI